MHSVEITQVEVSTASQASAVSDHDVIPPLWQALISAARSGDTFEEVRYSCDCAPVSDQEPDEFMVLDGYAIWDDGLQKMVAGEVWGDTPICNGCGRKEVVPSATRVAAKDRLIARYHQLVETVRESRERLKEVTRSNARVGRCSQIIYSCEVCGSTSISFDAYLSFDIEAGEYNLVATYDSGHSCRDCFTEDCVTEEQISVHGVLSLLEDLRRRADSAERLRQQIRVAASDLLPDDL